MYAYIYMYVFYLAKNGLLGASIETNSKICCSNIKLFKLFIWDAII